MNTDAIGDVSLITGSQGSIIYHDGTGFVELPAGTEGQVLQTGGGASDPSWVDRVEKSAVNPLSPDDGDTYYNTLIDKLMIFDATRSKWLSVS
ncbi:MAG: hypothetical protein AAGM67_09660, partial [Bacteroidota bacterium]